jgi:hypothetical protein
VCLIISEDQHGRLYLTTVNAIGSRNGTARSTELLLELRLAVHSGLCGKG